MQAAFSTRTNLFSLLPALPLPPLTPASNKCDKGGQLRLFPPPPSPTHVPPIAEFEQFSATSAKSEDGLHLGA
jgi:hypothetical protein